MHAFFHSMLFCIDFKVIFKHSCSRNKKFTVFHLSERFKKNVNALIVNKSASKKDLYCIFIVQLFCKQRTFFCFKILLYVYSVRYYPALFLEFGNVWGAFYMSLCSGKNNVCTFQKPHHYRLIEEKQFFLLYNVTVPAYYYSSLISR